MRKKVILSIGLFLLTIISALLFLFVNFDQTNVLIEDNGYTIKNYDISVVVGQDKTLEIREDITVDFKIASHGIYRYIPLNQSVSYVGKDDKIQSRNYRSSVSDVSFIKNGTSETFKTKILDSYEEDGYFIMMLGTNVYELKNEKTFSFSYKYALGDDRDTIEDSFYFNIIGTGWNTSIENVNFTVEFPTDVSSQEFKYYVGKYGQSTKSGDSRLTTSVAGKIVTGHCVNLEYSEAITMFSLFEQGYFKTSRNIVPDILMILIIIATLGLFIFIYVSKKEKKPVIDVVEFTAPDDLTPTEVGYLNDGEITGDDLSSLVVYWASKGYLRIEEREEETKLIKIRDIPDSAKEHEKILFKGIFASGDEVDSENLRKVDPEVGINCKAAVEENKNKYFDNSRKQSLIIMGAFLVFAMFFQVLKIAIQSYQIGKIIFLGACVIISIVNFIQLYASTVNYKYKLKRKIYIALLILSAIIMILPNIVLLFAIEPYCDLFMTRYYLFLLPVVFMFVYPRLNKYTDEGREYIGRIRGLKRYIEVAEKDRLEKLVQENPNIFYDVLPYAYVLGVSDVYMNKFKDIQIAQPDWYYTDARIVSVWQYNMLVNSTLNGISSIINSSMIAKHVSDVATIFTSIGGGGHGGGGFSGGGFGGGGGGRF